MPVVTKEAANLVVNSFSDYDTFSLDLETTGLNPYLGAKIFSCIISTEDDDFYFNFDDTPDHLGVLPPEETILPIEALAAIVKALSGATVYIHNAKFDLRFLLVIGLSLDTTIVLCTQGLARLVNNRLVSYSLANLGTLIGHEKDDAVEKIYN